MFEYEVTIYTYNDKLINLSEAEDRLLNERASRGWEHYDTSSTPVGYKGSTFGFIYRFRRPKKGDGKPVMA